MPLSKGLFAPFSGRLPWIPRSSLFLLQFSQGHGLLLLRNHPWTGGDRYRPPKDVVSWPALLNLLSKDTFLEINVCFDGLPLEQGKVCWFKGKPAGNLKHVWQNHAKSMSFCRLSHNKPSSSHPCHCQSGCCAIISCCFCLMDCSWHPGKHPCVRKSPCYLAGSFSPKATLGHSPKVRLIEIHHGTRPANIVGCTDRSRTSRELGSEWL